MSIYIKSVQAIGVFSQFSLKMDFFPNVNVVFGKNGAGKTTILQILTNAVNADFMRFAYLDFKNIVIQYSDSTDLHIERISPVPSIERLEDYDDEIIVNFNGDIIDRFSVSEVLNTNFDYEKSTEINFKAVYFPSFRVAIDAWKVVNSSKNELKSNFNKDATEFIRRWLLPFVPNLSYPSIMEIEQFLGHERLNRDYQTLLDIFNNDLEDKKVVVNKRSNENYPPIEVVFNNGYRSKGLISLSSGERQLLGMLFAANQLTFGDVLLIDEPEISLHIDWERELIGKLAKISKGSQLIICTHSPVIGADHSDFVMKLHKRPYTYGQAFLEEELPF